jgi:ribose/xylose/arabinose/galactoside ABC-type transport system permease subunit
MSKIIRDNSFIIVLVVVVLIATVMTQGAFLRPDNIAVIVATSAVFGLLALGQGIVVISGGFDLSVGAIVAFCISLVANLKIGMGILPATIIMLLAGIVMGLINGSLIAFTKVPPFIVTLGMMSIGNSLSLILIPGQSIRVGEYKEILMPFLSKLPFGVNLFPILLIIIMSAIVTFLLHATRLGRYIYAVGSNEKTAILCGVSVKSIKIIAYALSGFLCGFGAIAYLFRNISAAPGATADFVLYSIAATMIGGISMYGGSGKALGLIVGIFCLTSINSVLIIAGIPPAVHKAVLGGIVLLAVSSQLVTRRKE